jgi:hypothetical protein
MPAHVSFYVSYLGISAGITAFVAWILYRNGEVLLADTFGDRRLAVSVNRLLAVGFCLVNLGLAAVTAQFGASVQNGQQVLDRLTMKLGAVLLVLGVAHLLNMRVLHGYASRRRDAAPGPRELHHMRYPMR